jgi:hypothetical protein
VAGDVFGSVKGLDQALVGVEAFIGRRAVQPNVVQLDLADV